MNEYETEEQQVEALKKWWKENGSSIVIGVLMGVSALFGWRYYDNQQDVHAVQASDMYMHVMRSAALKSIDDQTIDISNALINDYSDTPYAALSLLALAKVEYEKGNVDGAAAQLELAVKHASDEITRQLANLRLAKIYIEQEKYALADTLLNLKHEAAYDAQYEELNGDLYMAKGDVTQARTAYDKAISLQGLSASKWLKLKRQNLGASLNGTRLPGTRLPGTRLDVSVNNIYPVA
ncbi:MAG: tetratricopeptide repeat protein [Proteobacteria bacterium]|nr:tetratricopeptide repeat protein [Pseudomonadota bacterium]